MTTTTYTLMVAYLFLASTAEITADEPEFYINFCAPTNEKASSFYILNAVGATTVDNFCQALSSKKYTSHTKSYDLTINLYNFKGSSSGLPNGTSGYGHPGVIFNSHDSLYYEFVYFRPHSTSSACYQVLVRYTSSSNKWAYLLVNNRLVNIIKFHNHAYNRGGALAANGYENVVFFNSYIISTPSTVPQLSSSTMKGCAARTGWMTSSYLALVGTGGTWPASGFCRVQHHSTLSGSSSYKIDAYLYNVRSKDGATHGNLGLMYNVQDLDNFDFVYFKPHDAKGCCQVGYVKNGAVTTTYSGSCPKGPANYNGFWVYVQVHSSSNVQIFLGNKNTHVKHVNPHFNVTPRFGVIVANGFNNIIQAMYFRIYK